MIEGSRYVKPQRRTTAPSRLMCVVPEYWQRMEAVSDGDYYYNARFVWYTEGRRYGTKWAGSDVPSRLHPDDWWQYVYDSVSGNTRLYIVAPNAGDMLTSTAFWVWMERGCFSMSRVCDSGDDGNGSDSDKVRRWVGRFVMGGPPDIVHVACKKGSVCIVSLRNYTQETWRDLSRSMDRADGNDSWRRGRDESDFECPSRQCHITTRYMRGAISEWVRNNCGGWRETAAQLSVSLWRKKFYDVKVCRHGDDKASKLERQASYGGRNEVWYYGDCGNPDSIPDGSDVPPTRSEFTQLEGSVYRCDVTSQYPSLLATKEFPVRLVKVYDDISVNDLESLTRYYGVIADATVRTGGAEIPARKNGEPYYPIGTFRTTLVGPDCLNAIKCGQVCRVYRAACYQLGRPLASYATHLLAERQRCRDRHDGVGESFVKTLSVAIGGKFSQRSTVRKPDFNVVSPEHRWGPWNRIDPDGTVVRYVMIAGVAFEEVPSAGGSKLLSAVYCYLTAYGREQMRQIRESLCPCIPYAQCTDGIWVGDKGYATLKCLGLSSDRTPGTLRLVSRHDYARWYTPSHYYIDGRWTLSGYRHGARVETDLSVTEFRDINPMRTMPFKPPGAIKRTHVKRTLAGIRHSERIGPDGWAIPIVENERVYT